MNTLITLSQIYVPLIIVLAGGYIGIKKLNKKHELEVKSNHKKHENNVEKLINSVIEMNSSLTDQFIEINLKLEQSVRSTTQLVNSFEKIHNKVLVSDKNASEIIKDAIFTKQGLNIVEEMIKIYIENGLENHEKTLAKIESHIITILKSTDSKLRVINGMENYIINFDEFINDVRATNFFQTILQLMLETKVHHDLDKLCKEISEQYNIQLQRLNEKYKF